MSFNYNVSLLTFSLQTFPKTPPCSSSSTWSIFSVVLLLARWYALVHIHIFLNVTGWFHSVTCVCASRVDELALDDQLERSSLWRTHLSQSQCRVKAPWVFLIRVGVFVGVLLVQLTLGWSFWWGFMGIASDVIRRHNVTAHSLSFLLLQSFCSHFWGEMLRKSSNTLLSLTPVTLPHSQSLHWRKISLGP